MIQGMKSAPLSRYLLVWAALMILLALTLASAFVPLGWLNSALNMGIASIKAALVAAFFMRLRRSSLLFRVCAATALFTLALLFGLSGSDYATRSISPASWSPPAIPTVSNR
jgi:cytochrome c oxidase subunit IV